MRQKDFLLLIIGISLLAGGIGLGVFGSVQTIESYNINPKQKSFTVNPFSQYTISTWLPSGTTVTCEIHISGGNNDINFKIVGPSGGTVVERGITSTQQISWKTTENGYYQLYFDNSYSWFTSKQVWYGVLSADSAHPLSYLLSDLNSNGVSIVLALGGFVVLVILTLRLLALRSGFVN